MVISTEEKQKKISDSVGVEQQIHCMCRTRCHSRKNCPCKAAQICCSQLCHPKHTCTNTTQDPVAESVTINVSDVSEKSPPQDTKWVQFGFITLTTSHKKILQSKGQWLDDSIMTAAQNLLKEQFPQVGGLQPPILGDTLSMEPTRGEFIQVLCIRQNHWICISNMGCQHSTVKVYDSLHGRLDDHTKKIVADVMQCTDECIQILYPDVQDQSGASDCGLFAVAFATSLCYGEDPTTRGYAQSMMRDHLVSCVQAGEMKTFPIRTTRRPKEAKRENLPVYCVCRLGDDGTPMVECSSCHRYINLRNRIGNISRDPHYTYIFVAATLCYAFCKRQARPFVETRGKNAGFLEGNILMSGLMPFRTFCGPCTVLLWALFIVGMAVASARALF